MAMAAGYKGSTASREARELAETGQIQRKEDSITGVGVKSVWYRWSSDENYNPRNEAEARELDRVRKHWPDYYPTYKAMLKLFNDDAVLDVYRKKAREFVR